MLPNDSSSNPASLLAREYVSLTAKLKELEKEKNRLQTLIKRHFQPNVAQAVEASGTGYTVELRQMPGRRTLDTNLVRTTLEDQGFDPDDFYKVGAPFYMINVKES